MPLTQGRTHALLIRARSWRFALPIAEVVETCRPLPVQPIAGAPAFVRGVTVLRGAPVPVVDLAALLGAGGEARGARLVVLRAGARQVALEVDEVIGATPLDASALAASPPLLREAVGGHLEALGALDGALLGVIDAARLVPEAVQRAAEAS
jgi:purine-binding chemotaxis protein CheW